MTSHGGSGKDISSHGSYEDSKCDQASHKEGADDVQSRQMRLQRVSARLNDSGVSLRTLDPKNFIFGCLNLRPTALKDIEATLYRVAIP